MVLVPESAPAAPETAQDAPGATEEAFREGRWPRRPRGPTRYEKAKRRRYVRRAVTHGPSGRTVPGARPLSTAELAAGLELQALYARPLTRAECEDGPRPCPYVSCKHHLYLDVNPDTGSIKLNFPYLEPWELAESCSLDVAERGGITLEEVGGMLNLVRERVRQVEGIAMEKLKALHSPELERLRRGGRGR